MKIKILMISFFFIVYCVSAQTFNIDWQQNYGGSEADSGNAVLSTNDGGYLLGLTVNSEDGNITVPTWSQDMVLIKTNSLGAIEWQKEYGGSGYESLKTLKHTSDGNFIFAGQANSENGDLTMFYGSGDIWVVKVDTLGNILWQKSYGGSGSDVANELIQTTDGGFLIVGTTYSSDGDVTINYGTNDLWIVKIDSSGVIEWQKSFGGGSYDEAYSAIELNNNYIVVGKTGSIDVSGEFWALKIDSEGTLISENTYGIGGDNAARKIISTSDGGYAIVGHIYINDFTTDHSGYEYYIIKFNENDVVEWESNFGGSDADYAFDIIETIDGYIVCGHTFSDNGDILAGTYHGGGDIWVLAIDILGNLTSQIMLGGSQWEFAPNISKTSDSGFILSGTAESDDGNVIGNFGNDDAWIIKFDSTLNIPDKEKRKSFLYPNPVKDIIYLSTNHDLKGAIIYDLLGNKINVNKELLKQSKIDVSSIQSGIYMLILNHSNIQREIFKFIKE